MAESATKATNSYCGPCYSDNRRVSAINWCMECNEAICTDCTKNHSLYKPLRNHHLVDIRLKASHLIVDDISDTKCDTHEGREIEYYCTDHDQICCRDCLAKTHKVCQNTISLESASDNIKHSGIITDYNDRLAAILSTVNNLVENRKSNADELMKECQKIKDDVRQTTQNLIAHLHEVENEILAKVQTISEVHNSNFEKARDDASKIKDEIESHKKGIAFCYDHLSNKNTFMFIRKLESKLKHAEIDLSKLISNCTEVSIRFKHQDDIETLIKTLGKIEITQGQCSVKYVPPKHRHAQIPTLGAKILRSFELTQSSDLPGKTITGIGVTEDNKILLCKASSNEILVYNVNIQFIGAISLCSWPWCVSVVSDASKAVVTFRNRNSIQFIDTKHLTSGRTVDICGEVGGGIASTTDKILIGGIGKIYVLDTFGNDLHTISVSGDRVNYITVGIGVTKYYYSSSFDTFFCVNENGEQIFSYTIKGEGEHRDIDTDLQGNIYVVGTETNTIQRLHPDGSFDSTILDLKYGINEPLAIRFNPIHNKLYVYNFGGQSKLLVFDCK